MRIEIVPYQERWAREFTELGARLREGLGDLALRIDHIGSTSVPGLAAKDIIDVQVTVASLQPLEPLVERMTRAGFQWHEGIAEDHLPPGYTEIEVHWEKLFFREREGERRTHIHVRVEGAANQRYALLFRDFLRTNLLARAGYERTKLALAVQHPEDIDAYYDVKDPVCDIIMAGAEIWAASTGWAPGPSGA